MRKPLQGIIQREPSRPRVQQIAGDRDWVLITGAAHRLGRAMALDLAKSGWPVLIHYNSSRKAAEDLAAAIWEIAGTARLVQADLSQERETQS